jgi:subfamily B ATP-binding cassette protein MsbA
LKKIQLVPNFDSRLKAELLTQRRSIGLGIFCALIATALDGEVALLLKKTIDAIGFAEPKNGALLGDPGMVRLLGYYSLAVVGIFVAKYWFTRGQAYYLSKAAAKLATDLRIKLFRKLQRLPVSYFGSKRVGGIYSVLTNDVNVYQNAVGAVRDSIDGPAKAIIFFGLVIYAQWQLALIATLFLIPMIVIIQRNGRKMKAAQAHVQTDLAEVSAMSNEAITGTRVIRAFAAEPQIEATYESLVGKSYRSQVHSIRILAALRPLVELIGAVAISIVIYLCGWLAYRGEITVGGVTLLIFSLDRINQAFRSIAGVTNTYNMVQAASDRIYGEILDVPEAVDLKATRTLPNPQGRIEFRGVTFRYPDGTEALSNVSFTLEPGTSLALVGPSGAGKSTIADLILRFYDPTEGLILFDGTDVRELNTEWLRQQIGVVPQQTFLFAGTVKENVLMGDPTATDEQIAEASVAAHAEEFIRELPARYETEIGETGNRLSGGQRQRLAIARALVRRPTLLLLDEATSALDPTSERVVTDALAEIMKTRTTLFIAHRLTTAARADRILVLSKGEVVESGTHKELLESHGAYAGLFAAFSGGVLD